MATEEKKSALRTTGKVAWRVLLPFAAMRRTVALAKKEAERTKESLGALKELGDDARKTIVEGIKGPKEQRNDSFSDAMSKRSENALSEDELYRYFLGKKRVAIGTAAFFALMALYGMLGGIWFGHNRGIALGAISLLASQPVFFMVALGAQLRLWQLRTHRLSKEEKGGLGDFMREVKGWWWVTLDPEFGRKGGSRA
ncbi:hypothetical protein [Paraburkholderia ferrariae]|jgi:hypothetical protein|uniref:hypothetical protein n=1 Tax=Paraburkholderia ferrariae TaxID=386056 RepID=UPI0004876E91|nr:hypothetical protein [Paraburkholderia ferrariae]